MAHRKHLSQEGHAAAEPKKAAKKEQKHTTGNSQGGKFEKKPQQSNYGKTGKSSQENNQDLGNSHIIDEHGEY
jgi:hypothetical protein